MRATRRMPISVFAGMDELMDAKTVVGWIAVNHAYAGNMLSYLLWHLICFELKAEPANQALSAMELHALYLTKIPGHSAIPPRVSQVKAFLGHAHRPVARRLRECEGGDIYAREWDALGVRIKELNNQRNDALHSTLAWSNGHVVRMRNWDATQQTIVEPKQDERLRDELGKLGTEIGAFATRLGRALPYVANHLIIT